jgi:hypothetical protein
MAKFDFWKVYQGPRGPHLSQLTKYTVSKERKETGSMKPGKLASGRTRIQRTAE